MTHLPERIPPDSTDRLGRCERGATAIEYGLVLALIALAVIASITQVADKTINMWSNVATEVNNH